MKTLNFTTKQKGYGRQGLYFEFDGETYHICDVYPNVEEHFGIEHEDKCFYNEETDSYTDYNGEEIDTDHMYDDLDEWLQNNFKAEIGEILFESLDFEDYDFDFEKATFEEITEWAINY